MPKSTSFGTPSTVDQHIRRLDVAVDHQVLVGVLDRRADDPEQRHALRGRRRARGAVLGDRLPLHVLHHQVGLAGVGRAAVEHGGDVGMLEARQDLSLQEEAPLEVLGVAPAADQLQRDGLAERVIVAHGPVDRAHASVADAGFDAVGTDHPSDIRSSWIRRRVAAREVPQQDPGRCFEKATGTVVRGEERGHLIVNRRFITAGVRDEGRSLLGGLQQCCFEHVPNSLPVVRRHCR